MNPNNTPDAVYIETSDSSYILHFDSRGAYPFYVYNGYVLVGHEGTTHAIFSTSKDTYERLANHPAFKKDTEEIIKQTKEEIRERLIKSEKKFTEDWLDRYTMLHAEDHIAVNIRVKLKNSLAGRVWIVEPYAILSFWRDPGTAANILKIARKIKTLNGKTINPNKTLVAVRPSGFLKIKEYKRGGVGNPYRTDHELPPHRR